MTKNSWQEVKLGELLQRSHEMAEIDPDKRYRQVTVKLWGKGVTVRDEVQGIEIASSRRFIARPDQFIASRIDARNGAFGLIPDSLDGAVVTNDFPLFTVDRSRLLPKFLMWLSRTPKFVQLCISASEGSTNRVRLQEAKFLEAIIHLPPISEQRDVVAYIEGVADRLQSARQTQQQRASYVRSLLDAVYLQITAGALELPMSDIAPLVRRPVTVENEALYHELGVRSFGKGTFHKPALRGLDVATKKLFYITENDLLFNIVFAWEGAIAVAQQVDSGRVGSHRFLTCVPVDEIATSDYLRFHFLTDRGLAQIGQASPGGAGRNRTLGLAALAKILVPVPPIETQRWFNRLQRQAYEINGLQREVEADCTALIFSLLDRQFRPML